ncbi:MAG: DUF2161 family putative PD-(D/E)XK-type phosphodiesterase [Spirochaetaceae bacterium]
MKESDIYYPIKQYLEGQGYTVHGEVKNCDIVARKGEELVVVELKRHISLALLAQAVERKELTDSVYIGVPVPEGRNAPPNFRRTKGLLRRLELGCILVDTMKTKTRVRLLLHPYPFKQVRSHKKKRALIREIDGRFAEFDLAGQPVTRERITAYKQQSLYIALQLSRNGPSSPQMLREAGCSEKTQSILSANLYGWFDRVKRGVYTLNRAGTEALHSYSEIIEKIEDRGQKNL